MDAPLIELHETMIRLAKGIVTARERHGAQDHVQGSVITMMRPSPLAGLLDRSTSEIKASIGVWENWLKMEKARPT